MKRVLFVDDEEMVLSGLRRMLREERGEWEMSFALSGAEAIAKFEQQPYDVIVSDMRMPQMDGAQLLGMIRERYPDSVRIILSGHSDQEAVLRCVGPAHQFLSKPCTSEVLKATIHRVSGLKEHLKSEHLRRLVARLSSLPTRPRLYDEVVRELQTSDSALTRVGAIIANDIGMTAKILQLVNSSFFGLPQRITSAAHAASLLGLELMKALVLSAGVFLHPQARDLDLLPLESVTRHSLSVGSIARFIAMSETGDRRYAESALLAGILHDAGKVVLAACLPEEYSFILGQAQRERICLSKLETMALGADHAAVGAYLLELWALPTEIVEAVMHHHRPPTFSSGDFDLAGIVHVADALDRKFRQRAAPDESTEAPFAEDAWQMTTELADRLGRWFEFARDAVSIPS